MFEAAGELEPLVNLLFLIGTGAVAWHGIKFRDEDGNAEWVHLLFGCIAAVFFFGVLFQDVLGVVNVF
ncbi:MAG: hypothetical protein ISR51_00890 [Rhodospirillales bacterium]|nr:hypothetical protein [Alphaproteobacteria bacterium]MBL6947207.1 hypothetical protein [Rhodospirillales bacterium]